MSASSTLRHSRTHRSASRRAADRLFQVEHDQWLAEYMAHERARVMQSFSDQQIDPPAREKKPWWRLFPEARNNDDGTLPSSVGPFPTDDEVERMLATAESRGMGIVTIDTKPPLGLDVATQQRNTAASRNLNQKGQSL